MLNGDGQRCVAITKAGKRCRNRATAFGDGTLCAVHLRQRLGQSEMADIRAYRAENAASGPGMYHDATVGARNENRSYLRCRGCLKACHLLWIETYPPM
jgi:hypothetical protein